MTFLFGLTQFIFTLWLCQKALDKVFCVYIVKYNKMKEERKTTVSLCKKNYNIARTLKETRIETAIFSTTLLETRSEITLCIEGRERDRV